MDIDFKVHANVRKEIPEFILNHVLYCDNLTLARNQRSCLILAKNLNFYEFRNKQLLHCIDLSESCLVKEKARLGDYGGPRGKWFNEENSENNITSSLDKTNESMKSSGDELRIDNTYVSFGKFIYRNHEVKKVYLLIKCWDKLVVLERRESGLNIVQEYEKVVCFKLIHAKIKYHVVVEIEFLNGSKIQKDFNEKDSTESLDDSNGNTVTSAEMKKMLDRVRNVKTELQLQKAITQREFHKLRNAQAFGSSNLRTSMNLEEKQMLARCGDIWFRITPFDDLVIGIPLINNCNSGNYKILQNFKPILFPEPCVQDNCIFLYNFKLYKLKQSFDTLESLEAFFETEDEDLQENTWTLDNTNSMMPQSTAVLIVSLKLSQILQFQKSHLSLCFDIEAEGSSEELQIYEQQIFLKTLFIEELMSKRELYAIKFQSKTLHQDFLATVASSCDLKLCLEFKSNNDLHIFQDHLTSKFSFNLVNRNSAHLNDTSVTATEFGNNQASFNNDHILFYNNIVTSLWFAMLVVRELNSDPEVDSEMTYWKIYAPSEEKLFIFLKILFDDLLLSNCNLKSATFPAMYKPKPDKVALIEFENNLRQELRVAMELFNRKDKDKAKEVNELTLMQLKTDMLAMKLVGS